MTESAYALFQRGSALLENGHAHQAVVPLERARDLEPHKGSIREALGRAYYRSGRFESARAEFDRAVAIDPANDYAHFGLALCCERTGDLPEARAHAKLALAMRPDDPEYRRAAERITSRSA